MRAPGWVAGGGGRAPGQKCRFLVGDLGGYVTARKGRRWRRWGSRTPVGPAHPSTHHTLLGMRCATPAGSYPRLCPLPSPIGCPRSTSWKQPANQRAGGCDSCLAHLQPAGALQPSAASHFNITFCMLACRAWPSTGVGRGGGPFLPAPAALALWQFWPALNVQRTLLPTRE